MEMAWLLLVLAVGWMNAPGLPWGGAGMWLGVVRPGLGALLGAESRGRRWGLGSWRRRGTGWSWV